MSEGPKRKTFDPVALAAAVAAAVGKIEGDPAPAPASKPIPDLHALEVVNRAMEILLNSGEVWKSEFPLDLYRRRSTVVDDTIIFNQEPFMGASFGPKYELRIIYEGETVLLAKWYSEDDEDKMIFRYQPGPWLASF